MNIDFSSQEKADQQLEKLFHTDAELEQVKISKNKPVEDLHNATEVLLGHINWIPNARITNKKQERQRFLDSRDSGDSYNPEFNFKQPDWEPGTALELLEKLVRSTSLIDRKTVNRYGAKKIRARDLQAIFQGVFQEFRLYVKLVRDIEDREKWADHCQELWPMVDTKTVEHCREEIRNIEIDDGEQKNIAAEDLAEMFRDELERLGVEWKVEVRDVAGCYNIPDERTVVVAKGSDDERFYSEKEADMLTVHEIFHVVRAYNGIKTGEKAGLPPFLGMHTPFYDMTEEGGAIYREKKTGVRYPEKELDYYLKVVAAYQISEGKPLGDVMNSLVELGEEPARAFDIVARNREVLRHHIYHGGYYKHWKDREKLWPLLLGKINPGIAEKLEKEVEANGMLERPEVGPEKLFSELD